MTPPGTQLVLIGLFFSAVLTCTPTPVAAFSVSSKQAWQDTGLDVNVGDVVNILASGSIRFDSAGSTSTPDGFTEKALVNPDGTCSFLLCGISRNSLVARIGSADLTDFTTGFFVGSSFSAPASTTGRLFLGYNDGFVRADRSGLDTGGVGDNSGSFTADITITPAAQPPVVLVHGWCGAADETTFGNMKTLLETELGAEVFYFSYIGDQSNVPDRTDRADLIRIAHEFGKFIKQILEDLKNRGIPTSQVDVVTHSTGGLIARAWMAGLTAETYNNHIRRLILAGSPNFGFSKDGLAGLRGIPCATRERNQVARSQRAQMRSGTQFLKTLTEYWEQEVSVGNIRPQDIMTIVGCSASQWVAGTCDTDGIVHAPSASLPPRQPDDYIVSYVSRDHFGDMVQIDNDAHETYQLIKAFLGGETPYSPYNPTSVPWLLVTPLVDANGPFTTTEGIRFGNKSGVGRGLQVCEPPNVAIPVVVEKPYDSDGVGDVPVTGWWTIRSNSLINVDPEVCVVVTLDQRGAYRSNSIEANVPAGRPTITAPLFVCPKPGPCEPPPE